MASVAIGDRRQRALAELARGLERETRGRVPEHGVLEPGELAPRARLIAEMVVGGVVAVVQSQLLAAAPNPLVGLAPSLLPFVLRPYERVEHGDSGGEHPPVRTTYRTTRVLSAVAVAPRSNNREIADAAGLRDEGQTSKLLARLAQRGLVENVGLGASYGQPNEWLLTARGESVLAAAQAGLASKAFAGAGHRARSLA